MGNIVERLLSGEDRTLTWMVTLIENEIPSTGRVLVELHRQASHAHIGDVTPMVWQMCESREWD